MKTTSDFKINDLVTFDAEGHTKKVTGKIIELYGYSQEHEGYTYDMVAECIQTGDCFYILSETLK